MKHTRVMDVRVEMRMGGGGGGGGDLRGIASQLE